MDINIRISLGELLDRYSILSIKLEKITDKDKIQHIKYEHDIHQEKFEDILKRNQRTIVPNVSSRTIWPTSNIIRPSIGEYYGKLKTINLEIWDLENTIRELEAQGSYGPEFIETARNIYFKNDERAAIKKEANTYYDSDLVEEKSYVD